MRQLIKDLLGADAVAGEEAIRSLILEGPTVFEELVPLFPNASYNINHRLTRLVGGLGEAVIDPLIELVSRGTSSPRSPLVAAACLRGVPHKNLATPRVAALLSSHDPDVLQAAIEALGFLNADQYTEDIVKAATQSKHYCEKLVGTAEKCLARLVAAEVRPEHVYYDLAAYSRFVKVSRRMLEGTNIYWGRQFELTWLFLAELTPVAADGIVAYWLNADEEEVIEAGIIALAMLRLKRTVPALAGYLGRPMPSGSLAALAASALGDIGGPEALRAFLGAYPSPEALGRRESIADNEPDHGVSLALVWGAGVQGLKPYVDRLLTWEGEIRAQTVYALSFLDGVDLDTDKYVSDPDALVRGAAALYLAHRHGASAAVLQTLTQMAKEASGSLERLLVCSALVRCGRLEVAEEVYSVLGKIDPGSPPAFIRYLWKREILFALHESPNAGIPRASAWARLMNVELGHALQELAALGRRAPLLAGQAQATTEDPARAKKPEAIHLAIVVPLQEEFNALFQEIEGEYQTFRDGATGRYFYRFDRPTGGVPCRCVAAFVGDMGQSAAQGLTQRMIDYWAPANLALVGTLAGSRETFGLGTL